LVDPLKVSFMLYIWKESILSSLKSTITESLFFGFGVLIIEKFRFLLLLSIEVSRPPKEPSRMVD
jgi:hypothetical protein